MVEIPHDKDNSVYSYMNWNKIKDKTSNQYKLKKKYNTYDNYGLADIKSRKVIACVEKFGKIGDEIEVTFKNPVNYFNNQNKKLYAIIGDYKSYKDDKNDGWGHLYTKDKQRSVIEFIVGDGFSGNIKENIPELKNNPVVQIQRTGVNFL